MYLKTLPEESEYQFSSNDLFNWIYSDLFNSPKGLTV